MLSPRFFAGAPGHHMKGRSCDMYGAGEGRPHPGYLSPPRRDESRSYAFISFRYHAAYVAAETPAMPGSVLLYHALPGTKRSDLYCSWYTPRAARCAQAAALPSTTGCSCSATGPGAEKDRHQVAVV